MRNKVKQVDICEEILFLNFISRSNSKHLNRTYEKGIVFSFSLSFTKVSNCSGLKTILKEVIEAVAYNNPLSTVQIQRIYFLTKYFVLEILNRPNMENEFDGQIASSFLN